MSTAWISGLRHVMSSICLASAWQQGLALAESYVVPKSCLDRCLALAIRATAWVTALTYLQQMASMALESWQSASEPLGVQQKRVKRSYGHSALLDLLEYMIYYIHTHSICILYIYNII